jgi:predicted phosphoribosyltransferase
MQGTLSLLLSIPRVVLNKSSPLEENTAVSRDLRLEGSLDRRDAGRRLAEVRGRTVFLVDDGLDTGASM